MRIPSMLPSRGSIYTQTLHAVAGKDHQSSGEQHIRSTSQYANKDKIERPEPSIQSATVNEAAAPKKVKNNTSLPDHLFEYIQKQAAEDAKKGIYKSEEYKGTVLGHMRKNISPNRAKLISMFNPMVMNARYTGKGASYFSVPGFSGFTARFSVGQVFGAYMSIRNNNGEEILSYTPPPNAGWSETQTKAEHRFLDEENAVYSAAFDEACKQIKAEAAGASHFSVQA